MCVCVSGWFHIVSMVDRDGRENEKRKGKKEGRGEMEMVILILYIKVLNKHLRLISRITCVTAWLKGKPAHTRQPFSTLAVATVRHRFFPGDLKASHMVETLLLCYPLLMCRKKDSLDNYTISQMHFPYYQGQRSRQPWCIIDLSRSNQISIW